MRAELSERLIRAYLSDNAPSRTSVCESTGVSKATASKVANALIESGFMCEKLFSLDRIQRPRLHLFLKDTVRILLIDLSAPRFKMSILSSDASTLFDALYSYDSSIPFDDNLNIFLSRCGLQVKHTGYSFSAISVLYADTDHKNATLDRPYQAVLPSIRQKDTISNAVREILGKAPTTHLTVSDSICEAMRFGGQGNDRSNGASYIFIGSRLLAFHVHPDGTKTVCSPERLLSEGEKISLRQPHLSSKEDTDGIFIRLCRFMDAAFSPSAILIESDIHTPDEITAKRISRDFALSGYNAPLISARCDSAKDLHIVGVLRHTVYTLVNHYITP